jgi:hypothetical protein
MEVRRNEPAKYDRTLWHEAIIAMKQILEISQRRTAHHIHQKLRPGRLIQKQAMLKKARTKMHMIRYPNKYWALWDLRSGTVSWTPNILQENINLRKAKKRYTQNLY